MKKRCVFLSMLLLLSLAACTGEEMPETTIPTTVAETAAPTETVPAATKPAQAQVTYKNYECLYEGRDAQWEEDVAYAAEMLLAKHPLFMDRFEYVYNSKLDTYMFVNRNEYYDGELRQTFLTEIEALIDRIPELEDYEIRFELMRIVALLGDAHTCPSLEVENVFPLVFEKMESNGETGLYVVRAPQDRAELIYCKLVSINGIAVGDVMDRLRPYVSSENTYWEDARIYDNAFSSLLVNQDALRVTGVVSGDSAEFEFIGEDGAAFSATIDVMPYEQAKEDGAWVDFFTQKIGLFERQKDENYWYQVLSEENTLYMRFVQCFDMEGYSFDTFCQEVIGKMEAASQPMKLIIDLRKNTGGKYPMDGYKDFLKSLRAVETAGIYVLVEGEVFSSGNAYAFSMRNSLKNAVFMGAPTGQPDASFGDISDSRWELPNSGLALTISKKYLDWDDASEYDALIPDVLIYQNLDDHKQGIDTVLEAALAD